MKRHAYYIGGGQILGRRENQEDAFLVSPEAPSASDASSAQAVALPGPVHVVLADGMGGEQDGEIASDIVSRAAMEALRVTSVNMAQVAINADEALRRIKASGKPDAGAGSTLIAATFLVGDLSWASVGDSLLLLYRGGKLTLLNKQHIMAHRLQQQVESGQISQQEADAFPTPQALYSAVCGEGLEEIDAPESLNTEHGDRFIIASDGLLTLGKNELESFLESHATCTPAVTVKHLLETVERVGKPNQDNTTVVIVDYFYEADDAQQKGPTTRIIRRPMDSPAVPGVQWRAFSQSILGDRSVQQDRRAYHSNDRAVLAAVIDGAGGMQGGELAAEVAREEVDRLWEKTLQTAPPCSEAREIIRQFLIDTNETVKTRATVPSGNGKAAIVILYACGGEICIGNVGDCRGYRLIDHHRLQLTEDDSMLALQVKMGTISEKEAWKHPDQSRLTQALGGDSTPKPHVSVHSVSPSDGFLLCCDGLWGQLHPSKWDKMPLRSATPPPEKALRNWVERAYQDANGDSDNITAILICPAASIEAPPIPPQHPLFASFMKLPAVIISLLGVCCLALTFFAVRSYFNAKKPVPVVKEKTPAAPKKTKPKKAAPKGNAKAKGQSKDGGASTEKEDAVPQETKEDIPEALPDDEQGEGATKGTPGQGNSNTPGNNEGAADSGNSEADTGQPNNNVDTGSEQTSTGGQDINGAHQSPIEHNGANGAPPETGFPTLPPLSEEEVSVKNKKGNKGKREGTEHGCKHTRGPQHPPVGHRHPGRHPYRFGRVTILIKGGASISSQEWYIHRY